MVHSGVIWKRRAKTSSVPRLFITYITIVYIYVMNSLGLEDENSLKALKLNGDAFWDPYARRFGGEGGGAGAPPCYR